MPLTLLFAFIGVFRLLLTIVVCLSRADILGDIFGIVLGCRLLGLVCCLLAFCRSLTRTLLAGFLSRLLIVFAVFV